MENHGDYFMDLYEKMIEELGIINLKSVNGLETLSACIDVVKKTINTLRKYVLENDFISGVDEIHFFKTIKPLFYAQLLYYGSIYDLELNKPTGGRKTSIIYIKKKLDKLTDFFEGNRAFYQYYRTGAVFMDNEYFKRHKENTISTVGIYGFDTDPSFTTGQDFLVSRIEANERLKIFLEDALLRIKIEDKFQGAIKNHTVGLVWTGSKVALVELMYALHSAGVFNKGNTSIYRLAVLFEECFNIKLGSFYKIFQDIRKRKKNKTVFLDELKKQLILKMEIEG